MGLVIKEYKPYTVLDNLEYYKIGTVAEAVGRTVQMIRLWDTWSDQLQSNEDERLIPKSTRIGKNGVRCWTASEVFSIIEFSKGIKYGDLSKFSRTRWGEKTRELKQDRSTESRNAKRLYRNEVNRSGKKTQNKRKVAQIRNAKGTMLKTVRRTAGKFYNNLNL